MCVCVSVVCVCVCGVCGSGSEHGLPLSIPLLVFPPPKKKCNNRMQHERVRALARTGLGSGLVSSLVSSLLSGLLSD